MRLHHVHVTCARGGEDAARRFYADGLGLTEVPKPAALAGRGGCWFRGVDAAGQTVAEVHVGIADPVVPARKGHPAFVVDDAGQLEAVGLRLTGLGFEVDWGERHTFAGFERFHTADAAGNRVEILTPAA